MAEVVVAQANALKEEGNKLLATHMYAQAAEKYSEAIALHPSPIYYANRAQALIKLESYGLAISDANEAIKLDPAYIKAYYRRATSNIAINKLKEALKDLKAVVKIVPSDAEANKKLKACEKRLREEAFNKAIETSYAPAETAIDPNTIVVDSHYVGPRLQDAAPGELAQVTMEFVYDLTSFFREQRSIHKKYVLQILLAARAMFKSLPSLLEIPITEDPTALESDLNYRPHINVCGDTHGQFYDLLNIFHVGGLPSASNPYIFNGDFVDRGSFSFETVTTLLAFKLACPSCVHMLRGNHETKNMNKIYGFEGEVLHKYDDTVMKLFAEVFNWLPLCAVIEKGVFVVHGGLTTENGGEVPLSTIAALPRNREPPESGLMTDLLWADPQPHLGRSPSNRGMGFSFGPDITNRFLETNNLKLLVRSHEVKQEGHEVAHNGKCITVFSAPNYCDQMNNKGAFIRFEKDLEPRFTQFTCVPHPNVPAMRYAGNIYGL